MTSVILTDEKKEQRNKVMMPTMIKALCASLPKVEKTLKVLKLDLNQKYAFGESISLVDLDCLWYYLWTADPFVNQYIEAKKMFAEVAPTILKLAEKSMKHPVVAEYLADDGKNPFLGINTLW